MSLSHNLAQLNESDLREALHVLAAKVLARGGGMRTFDNWMRPVDHAFHAGGWTRERLREFKRMCHEEFSKAKAALQTESESIKK